MLAKDFPKNSMKTRSSTERPAIGRVTGIPSTPVAGPVTADPVVWDFPRVFSAFGLHRAEEAFASLRGVLGRVRAAPSFLKDSREASVSLIFFFKALPFTALPVTVWKPSSSPLPSPSHSDPPVEWTQSRPPLPAESSLRFARLLDGVITPWSMGAPPAGCSERAEPEATRPSLELMSSQRRN